MGREENVEKTRRKDNEGLVQSTKLKGMNSLSDGN